jgi:predicted nucleotidyltransferase
MNNQVTNIMTLLRKRFEELYGNRLHRMILFGSHARGDAEPESDIDVLVVLEGPVNAYDEIERTGYIVSGISLDHNVVIGCVFTDLERYKTRQGPFLRNIRREGVAV